MSIKFKAIPRKNPQNLTAAPKYFAIASSDGLVGIDRLCQIIADGSTVRQNDVYAVLIGLVNAIIGELSAGRTVKIDKLGVFTLFLSSRASETANEVSIDSIKSVRLGYRASPELKKMLANLSFTKKTTDS